MDPYNASQPEAHSDVLSSFETNLEHASTGKRFANFLIDRVATWIVMVGIVYLWIILDYSSYTHIAENRFLDILVSLLIYAVLMGLTEGIFKGRTLGKLITGTKAVYEDGSTLSFGTAMLRGFSRIVPFEPFSAFGNPSYPWHDQWTKTMVIDIKKSNEYGSNSGL